VENLATFYAFYSRKGGNIVLSTLLFWSVYKELLNIYPYTPPPLVKEKRVENILYKSFQKGWKKGGRGTASLMKKGGKRVDHSFFHPY
jgi:hypothetical protein